MPYTLAKGFVWIALALLLGVIIGWLLRSIVAKRQVARARAHHVDSAEMERLRGRVANLEPVVAERDRLRDELDGLRSISAGDSVPDETASVATFASVDAPGPSASTSSGPTASPVAAAPAAPAVPSAPSAPDVDEGSAILGRIIELDDLKVVEGIGPKIEGLCNGIGIRTWFDLSTTEVSLLRTMLADAGSRFRSHDPATWPQQASLLAHGRWAEFGALTDELRGGRSVD